MNRFITRVAAIAHKETLHLVRDTQALYLAIGMPLVLVILFGFAVSFDLDNIDIAVVDLDRTAESRDFVERLTSSSSFRVTRELTDPTAAERLFRTGNIQAALVIPEGHARSLFRGETAEVQLMMDGSDGTTTQLALGHAVLIAQAETLEKLTSALPEGLPIQPRARVWYNPEMRSALFVVPGLVGAVLAILSTLLSALTVAREWERGSMEQLFATPVGRLPIVLGKLLPYVGLGLLQLGLVIASGVWLFNVPIVGSIPLLLVAAGLFLVCVLGQGFLISTITKNQQVATQIAAVSSILPSFLLSGFLFPVHNMPLPLQVISNLIPTKWVLVVFRGVMLKGSTFSQLAPNFVALTILAFFIVGLSTVKFQRKLG